MKSYKEIIIITGITALAFGGLIWLASPADKISGQTAVASQSIENTLVVSGEAAFDFGEISMAKGDVSRIFTVKNNGKEAVMLDRLYTSCMCTSASLILDGKRTGPFGMAGHGFVPRVRKEIPAGGEAQIEVVFDPAAHGPAGVGLIERVVAVESSGGDLELRVSALVKP